MIVFNPVTMSLSVSTKKKKELKARRMQIAFFFFELPSPSLTKTLHAPYKRIHAKKKKVLCVLFLSSHISASALMQGIEKQRCRCSLP